MPTNDTLNQSTRLTSIPNPDQRRKAPPTIDEGDTVFVRLPGHAPVKASFRFARVETRDRGRGKNKTLQGQVYFVDVYYNSGGQRTVPVKAITLCSKREVEEA